MHQMVQQGTTIYEGFCPSQYLPEIYILKKNSFQDWKNAASKRKHLKMVTWTDLDSLGAILGQTAGPASQFYKSTA